MEATVKEVVWVEYDKSGMLCRLTDTIAEMARQSGVSANSIKSIASRVKSGIQKNSRFMRIELPEDED